jgi:hypothetical protein
MQEKFCTPLQWADRCANQNDEYVVSGLPCIIMRKQRRENGNLLLLKGEVLHKTWKLVNEMDY